MLLPNSLYSTNIFYHYINIFNCFQQKEYKATIDGTIASKGSSIRGASQVLACSFLATILSLVHAFYCGKERSVVFDDDSTDIVLLSSRLTCGIIAHHATCLADTLAIQDGPKQDSVR